MRVHRLVLLAVALGCVALAADPLAGQEGDDLKVALERTTALQDTARILRNGATSGARPPVLAAEAARLRESLDVLIAAQHRWAANLPEARRTAAVAAELAIIEDGCDRMRATLEELDRTLHGTTVDRAVVQSAGQRIGRQAWLCARALRRAERG
jgi:hypothetical protein